MPINAKTKTPKYLNIIFNFCCNCWTKLSILFHRPGRDGRRRRTAGFLLELVNQLRSIFAFGQSVLDKAQGAANVDDVFHRVL